MKDYKITNKTEKPKVNLDFHKIVKTVIKFLVRIAEYLLIAYGLRHMFTVMQDTLSVSLTIGIVVLMAYVDYEA